MKKQGKNKPHKSSQACKEYPTRNLGLTAAMERKRKNHARKKGNGSPLIFCGRAKGGREAIEKDYVSPIAGLAREQREKKITGSGKRERGPRRARRLPSSEKYMPKGGELIRTKEKTTTSFPKEGEERRGHASERSLRKARKPVEGASAPKRRGALFCKF